MIKYRIHLRVFGGVRCGQRHIYNSTFFPKEVTCESCKRLMKGEVK